MNEDEMMITTAESEHKTKTATGIGRYLTQKIIRKNKIDKLMQYKVHGASYSTLKMNQVSNAMLTNIYTRKSDTFFRFVVVGRADCLPTPVNLRRWFGQQSEANCRRCGRERQQTFAHILNEYTPNYPLMTIRHNQLAKVVRNAIEKHLARELRSEIKENQAIEEIELPEEMRRLRPDMIFERRRETVERRNVGREGEEGGQEQRERKMMEIVEFSCPYGFISREQDTLERVYNQKKQKYAELARELKRQKGEEV
jgi:hypothetical protein